MSVVVHATLVPAPQHAQEVEDVLRETIPLVHAEDGCELYALHRAPDGAFVFVERWTSPEALQAHGAGATMADMTKRLSGLLGERPAIVVLEPLPTGDGDKGAV